MVIAKCRPARLQTVFFGITHVTWCEERKRDSTGQAVSAPSGSCGFSQRRRLLLTELLTQIGVSGLRHRLSGACGYEAPSDETKATQRAGQHDRVIGSSAERDCLTDLWLQRTA